METTVKKIENVIVGYCEKIKQADFQADRSCIDAVDIIAKLSHAMAELKRVQGIEIECSNLRFDYLIPINFVFYSVIDLRVKFAK